MNIKPYDKTIRDLLGSKRQFLIPRFQREYSWEKKNYQEFFEDMMGNLVVSSGKIAASQYFLGTMLFIGNFAEGTDQEIQVVDGQQRLTTITILFSALSDRFIGLGEATLSRQIFTYIMTEDDDGNEVRILKSKTNYPFFEYFIQDKEKKKLHKKLAKNVSKVTGYKIKSSKNSTGGYKDWCVEKLGIPALTIEVGDDKLNHPLKLDALDDIYKKNKRVIEEVIKTVKEITWT